MTMKDMDRFQPARWNIRIEGFLGEKIDSCIQNGIMAANYSLFSIPFREKTDDGGSWGGEFWGKWFTSAALAYRYEPKERYREILEQSVNELLATQSPNGRISSCNDDFGNWDIWGRKYALLGLIAYYDQTGESGALEAASRAVDELLEVAGPGRRKLTETGLSLVEALSSCSILEPVALLYQRTGNKNYLEFAKYIVALWSEPNKYTATGIRLVEDALAGMDPVLISAPKGYEMMSCYEGLCELYRSTGETQYLEAAVRFGHKVRQKEIMIVGSGSSCELWCDGANRQTELLEQPMETCVTATWMKLCYQLSRLTGDSVWADELEISLYNALLGAMVPDGSWWAYFSPLTGERVPSHMQNSIVQCSCCSANGPRGLLTVPGWSIMTDHMGPIINLYSKGTWTGKLANGTEICLQQQTDYPVSERIEIKVRQTTPADYTIRLRIPNWSHCTQLEVNGEKIGVQPGVYAAINRTWNDGDTISLRMDVRGRVITAPGSMNQKAVMRGPIVLALDNRFIAQDPINLWLHHDGMEWSHNADWNIDYVLLKNTEPQSEAFIELTPCKDKPDGVWMAFEVPFLYRQSHFIEHRKMNLIMCDYASAGNEYSELNLYRVWLPQPVYLSGVFPVDTWKSVVHSSTRPVIPDRSKPLKQSESASL